MKVSTAHMLFQKKWFNLPKESFATWQLTDGSNFFFKKSETDRDWFYN